jgi:hypothetical protein
MAFDLRKVFFVAKPSPTRFAMSSEKSVGSFLFFRGYKASLNWGGKVTRDGRFYVGLWRTTEPIFQALKDDNPNIITVSRSYREPICFDTENNIQRRG